MYIRVERGQGLRDLKMFMVARVKMLFGARKRQSHRTVTVEFNLESHDDWADRDSNNCLSHTITVLSW